MGSGSYTKVIYGHPNWQEFVGEAKMGQFELAFEKYEETQSCTNRIELSYDHGFLGVELLSSLNDDFDFDPIKLSDLSDTILKSIDIKKLKRAKKEWKKLKKALKKIGIDLLEGELIWTSDYD